MSKVYVASSQNNWVGFIYLVVYILLYFERDVHVLRDPAILGVQYMDFTR